MLKLVNQHEEHHIKHSLHTVFKDPPIDSYSTEGKKLDNFQGNVQIRGVHFRYPSRPEAKVRFVIWEGHELLNIINANNGAMGPQALKWDPKELNYSGKVEFK